MPATTASQPVQPSLRQQPSFPPFDFCNVSCVLNQLNDTFLSFQVAKIRLALEQKVMRLEEAVKTLNSEKKQISEDVSTSTCVFPRFIVTIRYQLAAIDSSRKQLRDHVGSSSLCVTELNWSL